MTIRTERRRDHPEERTDQDEKQRLNGQSFYGLYRMDQDKSIGQDERNRSKFNDRTDLRGDS
jgi:hypothetical protein